MKLMTAGELVQEIIDTAEQTEHGLATPIMVEQDNPTEINYGQPRVERTRVQKYTIDFYGTNLELHKPGKSNDPEYITIRS